SSMDYLDNPEPNTDWMDEFFGEVQVSTGGPVHDAVNVEEPPEEDPFAAMQAAINGLVLDADNVGDVDDEVEDEEGLPKAKVEDQDEDEDRDEEEADRNDATALSVEQEEVKECRVRKQLLDRDFASAERRSGKATQELPAVDKALSFAKEKGVAANSIFDSE